MLRMPLSDPNPTRHALVIGAGLAGAAVCVALTRRGWRATLVDAAPGPALAASALPVGMLSPHVTRAPTPLSRLSALGVADMRAQLERLVPQGAGWQPCEVDNLGHDPGRWPAALVRPAALVNAWLDEAQSLGSLQTMWNAPVAQLRPAASEPDAGGWQALASDGHVLAEAPAVVVTAAYGSHALLAGCTGLDTDALPLRPVQGQMSLADLQDEPLAPRPQRDNGVFVPVYEDSGLPPQWPARIWAMGSTYERGLNSSALSDAAHLRNAQSLQAMHPAAAQRLRDAMAQGQLRGWAQVRCASLDRLPLMGAVPDTAALQALMAAAGARRGRVLLSTVPRQAGLYTLSALGSRGLTLSHWCATQLAALMDGQAPGVAAQDADLIAALDPARFAWRQARRQPQPMQPSTVTPA
jgi:tRNA 5-methylaminomethyl-2-thiouridine biosynthesis bifunctional protein